MFLLVGIMLENAEGQAGGGRRGVVNDAAEHAEGAVIDLVDGQIAAEASQGLVQIGGGNAAAAAVQIFFFPGGLDPVLDGGKGDETRWSRHKSQLAER